MPPVNENQPPATVNNVWGEKAASGSQTETRTLPSGQTATCRKIGIEELLMVGLLLELESLSALVVAETVDPAKAKLAGHRKSAAAIAKEDAVREQAMVRQMMTDPTLIMGFISAADRVMPLCVVDPPVTLHYAPDDPNKAPLPPEKRIPGQIYTDMIDWLDKMDIMVWAIDGLDGLAQFRA